MSLQRVVRMLLQLLSMTLLYGGIYCQDACERITTDVLGNSDMFEAAGLVAISLNPGGDSVDPDVRTLNMSIVCEAQDVLEDRYRYTSVVVSFNCFSTDIRISECNDSSVVHTEQFDFGCAGGTWTTNILSISSSARTTNPIATLTTELDTGCILCVNPANPAAGSRVVSNVTHCEACSDCPMGLQRCYYDAIFKEVCCNFISQSVCVTDCPGLLVPNTNFECVCPELTEANGNFEYAGNQSIGSEATLTCNTGFELDSTNPVTCQASGQWTGMPTCEPVCGELIANCSMCSVSGRMVTCTQCSSPEFEIINGNCSLIECDELSEDNGAFDYTNNQIFGSNATLTCDTGFEVNGSNPVTCQSTSEWTGTPTCEPVCGELIANCSTCSVSGRMVTCTQCSSPEFEIINGNCSLIECDELSEDNGAFDYTNNQIFGSDATLTCDTGFEVNGSNPVTCQSTSEWTGTPTCEPVCGELIANCSTCSVSGRMVTCTQCSSPEFEIINGNCSLIECDELSEDNGAFDYTNNQTFGSSATLTCDTGFEVSGSNPVTCQSTSEWTGTPPTCQPVCGELIANCSTCSVSGQMVTCTQCSSPEFEIINGNCSLIECDQLSEDNGAFDYTNNQIFGSDATLTCDTGFEVSGSNPVTCQSTSEWTGTPTCEPVCSELIANCSTCSVSGQMVTCTQCSSPEFEIINGNCSLIVCDALSEANGNFVYTKNQIFGSSATLTCNTGFEVSGSNPVTCEAGGWTGMPTCQLCSELIPNCQTCSASGLSVTCTECSASEYEPVNGECAIIVCDALSEDNGAFDYTNEQTFGSNATLTCDTGFEVSGSNPVTCQAGGWTGTPTCQLCSELIPNCQTCSASGLSVICTECSASEYELMNGVCALIVCDELSEANGAFDYTNNRIFGSDATLTCDTGFEVSGSNPVTCQVSGWTGMPKCQLCSELIPNCLACSVSGQDLTCTECLTSYELTNGVCAIECDELSVENGNVAYTNGQSVGSVATLTCNTGFEANGPNPVTCESSAEWTGEFICESQSFNCDTGCVVGLSLLGAVLLVVFGALGISAIVFISKIAKSPKPAAPVSYKSADNANDLSKLELSEIKEPDVLY